MSLKISIITICFNNIKDIGPTIESVINQTYNNIEYIVIDGASTDGTTDIIKKYIDRISSFVSEKDEGMYDAINKGIKRATGEVVGLIHAGDRIYEATTIAKIAETFNSNSELDCIYGNSKVVTTDGKIRMLNIGGIFSKERIKKGWMPSHQSIYLKRSLFDKLGYYRNDLGGSGDYELFIRFFYCNNFNVEYIDEFILYFTLGGRSTNSIVNKFKVQKTHIRCWELNDVKPPKLLVFWKIVRTVKKYLTAVLSN